MEANVPAIPPLPPLPPLPLSPLAPVLTPTPARPSLYTPVLPLLLPPLALPPLALLVVPGGGLGGPSGFLVSKWRPAQPHNECQVQELKHIQHTADKDQSCRSHTVAIYILEAIQALHDCMLCRFISRLQVQSSSTQLKANTIMTQCKSQYNSCIQTAFWCDGGKHTGNSSVATFASIAIVSIGSSVDSNSSEAFVVHSGVTIVVTTVGTASIGVVGRAWRGLGWAIRLLGQQVASCTATQ